jgi:hypothetical protein
MSAKATFKMKSKIVVFPGMGAWRFLMVEKKVSDTIKKTFASKAVGFGSIRVHVQVGKTKWDTSIFPDKKSSVYLLPTKASVRKAEGILDDEPVSFTITIA